MAAIPIPAVQAVESARAAGLRHVSDAAPGIRRIRAGKGFRYAGPDGSAITDQAELARIKALAVPPAWTDVWICPSPRGHIQATGRDARGRKQYRYHDDWRTVRDENKYERLVQFGEALRGIRKQVLEDMSLSGLPRAKVVATVVWLLDRTLIRVGNDEYARGNGSYGLTTLRAKHVDVSGSTLRFEFKGKSGKVRAVDVQDRRAARVVRCCRELPGYELFQYVDDKGERRTIDSEDVNEYLREVSGADFTAKDFRTWAGTVLAARALHEIGTARSGHQAKRNVVAAVQAVAHFLGNTPSVCRKCYVHPGVIEAYTDGTLDRAWHLPARASHSEYALRPDEAATLGLLRRLNRRVRRGRSAA